MRRGDIIWVKEGVNIVGRGRVIRGYKYRFRRILDDTGYSWPHQIPVNWDASFIPFRAVLGVDQYTVLPLTKDHLRILHQFESGSARSCNVTEAEEGEWVRKSIRFRRRNRSLIEAKRAQCAENMKCEGCRFSFKKKYGNSVKELLEVHHRNPMAELRGVRVTTLEDLALLCPNCHRVLHWSKPMMTVEALKETLV